MTLCSATKSHESGKWPEGIISVRMTMNPYLLAMAEERAHSEGVPLWEYVNAALWEKLGKPECPELYEFAAGLPVDDEDPKWKKRLSITARHEMAVAAVRSARAQEEAARQDGDNGSEKEENPGG
ncbi:MAG: hypothetical protein AB1646_25455 [Thermodesulfobacteriota bacterium]